MLDRISQVVKVYLSWRMLVVLLLGFSSGMPLGLTSTTLQAWMKERGVSLSSIGLLSLVGLPYALKFIWSPLMDRYVPPLLGRRRGWMVLSQAAIVVGVCCMAATDPARNTLLLGALALAVSFFSASQDIVIDAFRVEILRPHELGAGSTLAVQGYRIAMIVSGAVAMIMADHMAWSTVYLLMAAVMAVGIATSLLAPEPQVAAAPPRTLQEAVVEPFKEFLLRQGAIEMLIFILIYKLDVAMAQGMSTVFLLGQGFSNTEIGVVNKGAGLAAMIAGSLIAGGAMVRLGLRRSLWVFGLAQGISGLSFAALAAMGKNYPMMAGAIVAENFCAGTGVTAFTAFLMSVCNKRFTATQYALLSSFMGLSRVLAGAPTGYLADKVGWVAFFVIATLAAAPGLALLTRFNRWQIATPDIEAAAAKPQPAQEPVAAK